MPRTDSGIYDRFDSIYPGAIVDCLDERGYMNQTLHHSIGPLTMEMRVAGLAFPVVGQPDPDADYEANIRRFLRMLGEVPSDSVIVYETNDDQAAQLGELSTAALQARGCRGAVVDGGVRDINHILDQNFPVFARYRTPADAPPRWRLTEWDVPVEVGGVEIHPGDILVGDADGVVCVPSEVALDVLEEAEGVVSAENKVRTAVRSGVPPIDAYEEYGTF